MTTPRKTPIDLSKCKVGQWVRLRNQQEERIVKINTGHSYPYACKNGITWDEHGRFQHGKEHPFDIVAVLPPAKKAKAKSLNIDTNNQHKDIYSRKPTTLDRLASAFSKIAFKGDNDLIRKAADQLEGLLKP